MLMRNHESFSNDSTNSGENSAEEKNLALHKKKLVGYYLSHGDSRYIFESGKKEFSESSIDEESTQSALDLIRERGDFCKKIERNLLLEIAPSSHGETAQDTFEKFSDDKHQKRILTYLSGGDWDDYDSASGETVGNFLRVYPTPIDFESDADRFLKMIGEHNSRQKYDEYAGAMENFKKTVYGKRYEYYKAMKELHKEAEKMDGSRDERTKRVGLKVASATRNEALENETNPVVAAGGMTLNKGILTGDKERKNEDAAYCNWEKGVFAVFDGAGGVHGGARASEIANYVTGKMVEWRKPGSAGDLKAILEKANEMMCKDRDAGISTGVICSVIKRGGEKHLAFASAGDSRIYIVRGGRAYQITNDEGYGNKIYNALGMEEAKIQQFGEYKLMKGDRIVLCSDGITGDYEKDFIPEQEFVKIVENAQDMNKAAAGLIRRATKKDDRTAVVFEV